MTNGETFKDQFLEITFKCNVLQADEILKPNFDSMHFLRGSAVNTQRRGNIYQVPKTNCLAKFR